MEFCLLEPWPVRMEHAANQRQAPRLEDRHVGGEQTRRYGKRGQEYQQIGRPLEAHHRNLVELDEFRQNLLCSNRSIRVHCPSAGIRKSPLGIELFLTTPRNRPYHHI